MRFTNLPLLLGLILFSFQIKPGLASGPDASLTSGGHFEFGSARPASPSQISWNQPVNLSRSGAASQPRLVVDSNSTIQAFWIDSFDGLVTAVYNGSTWSLPVLAPYGGSVAARNSDTEAPPPPPEFFVDGQNRIHALWHTVPDPLTGQPALNENQMLLGTTTWSPAVRIAESALVFDLASLSSGEIYIGYIRNYNSILSEPGLYVRQTVGGAVWQTAAAVHNSIYYRNLAAPPALVKTASARNLISIAWTEPRLGNIYSADSFDLGISWTEPQVIEFAGAMPTNPIVMPLADGGLLRIWQDSAMTSCTLYQQRLELAEPAAPATLAPTATSSPAGPESIPGAAQPAGGWSQPVRILDGLQNCPTGSNYVLDGEQLYWYWGEGTSTINLTAWNAASSTWYEPQAISLNFEDVETRRFVNLDELTLSIKGEMLMLAGTDKTVGEVWAASADRSAIEFASAPPSPWLEPLFVSQSGQQVREPAAAVDILGRSHIVWSQELTDSGSSLVYSRFENQQSLLPVEIFKGGGGTINRQPSMLVDAQNTLHLSWIGGANGSLNYSHAVADKAGSASGWVPALNLDAHIGASRPQIAQSASGRIYITYAIPVNESRGVFLVYSDDSGENWSRPVVVFDAVAAAWEGVDRPTIALTAGGGVHVAFSRLVGTGALPTEGIYYTKAQLVSDSAGFDSVSWSEPFRIAEGGNDWPRLAAVSGQLHVLFSDGANIGHRWLLVNQQPEDGAGWGDTNRVPGWQDMALTGMPPFTVVADAVNLYLVSATSGGTGLYFSAWNTDLQNPETGRWSQHEIYNPSGQWMNGDSTVAAATRPSGEQLLVIWQALAGSDGKSTPMPTVPGLLFSIRSLDSVNPPAAPVVEPVESVIDQPTPTELPTATQAPALITTPTNPAPQPPVSPQVLGGGLAAIIVVIIFVGIMMRGRGHSP